MTQSILLTPKKFKEIYTDNAFRNQVAHAHKCYDSNSNYLRMETCSYPTRYTVTQYQINKAAKEIEREKAKLLEIYNSKLVFVGMGGVYEPKFEGDVCNYRIRTEILNREGRCFFVEFGPHSCYHSIDRDLQITNDNEINKLYKERKLLQIGSKEYLALADKITEALKQSYNNYKGLELAKMPQYTLENILNLVNETFMCDFKDIIIDNYTLTCEDYKSISPK